MDEYIDIFDANHRHIGTERRSRAHQLGLWHQTFHCWITGKWDTQGFVLLQHRSMTKADYPGKLDITAAGHLEAGESPSDGVREIKEELGIQVFANSLRYLGFRHEISDTEAMKTREFTHVYLLRDDRPLGDYSLQAGEVSSLVAVPIVDGLRLFAGEVSSITCSALDRVGASEYLRQVTVADMVPRSDNYYLKIFIMADLFLSNARYLAV